MSKLTPSKKWKTGKKKAPKRSQKKASSGSPHKVEIAEIAIDRLNPAPYNPRADLNPGDPEYDKILRSIKAFGYSSLLTWNRSTGTLVGGHQRLRVMRDLGWKKIKVLVVHLNTANEKALNIALNQISGEFDPAKLSALLTELQADDSIDELLTGFDADELQAAIEETQSGTQVAFDTTPKSKWTVVVECKNEAQQRNTHKQLTADGYTCRVVSK